MNSQKEINMSVQCSHNVNFKKIDAIIQSFDCKKSNLIAILQKVQEEFRYLPEEAMTYIGTKIEGLSPATVYGVATFYAQFSLEPKGKYELKVCDGTACHVRGSMPVLNAVKAKLALKEGQLTTDDGLFSLEIVSCLGACGLAPVLVINGKVYPQMTSDAVKIVLDTIIKEEN
jgi:NADH-quinone oxidoreductase subunit E